MDVSFGRSADKVRYYAKMIARLFRERIASGLPVRWLDVGAGYGEVVEAVTSVFPPSSYVVGIDPMKGKVDVARSLGLAVTDTPFAEVPGSYDVISLINVFSHIPDFKSFLLQISKKLSPEGALLIETGNAGDLAKREDYPDQLYLPDHLVFAGRAQMRSMLEAFGFAVDRIVTTRMDNLAWAVRTTGKSFLAGRPVVSLPYRSPFRSVFYKAQMTAAPS